MNQDAANSKLGLAIALVLVVAGVTVGGVVMLGYVYQTSPVASALFTVCIIVLIIAGFLLYRRDTMATRSDYLAMMREQRTPRREPEQIIEGMARTLPQPAQLPARTMQPKTSIWVKVKGGGVNIPIAQLSKLIDAYPATSRAALDGAITNGAEDHHRLMEAARALGWLSEGGQGRKTSWNVSQEQARTHLQRLSMEAVNHVATI